MTIDFSPIGQDFESVRSLLEYPASPINVRLLTFTMISQALVEILVGFMQSLNGY